MKTCSKCNLPRPLDLYRARKDRGARHTICKDCEQKYRKQYKSTPIGRANAMWQGIQRRSHNNDGMHPTYRDVDIRMTKEEFLLWAVPALREWYAHSPQSTPTLDRIDSSGHYEISNLRLLTAKENTHYRGSNKNVYAPKGMAWCSVCKTYLPKINFYSDSRKMNGLQTRCKNCHYTKYKKGAYRRISSQEKLDILNRARAGESGRSIARSIGRSAASVCEIIRSGIGSH